MPRKYFRKYLPTSASIREHRLLGRFGGLHHPNIWHLNRNSVAGGFAAGLFAGLVPGPLQMLVAALLAIPLRVNLPVAVLTTLYTNPLTIVPLYVLAYEYGSLLLGTRNGGVPLKIFEMDWTQILGSMQGLSEWTMSLGKPLLVGLVALALTLAALGYFTVQIGWRIHVTLAWRARKRKRQASQAR